LARFQIALANSNKAIALLVEAWPGQLNIADFKGQTPLMLVAGDGNDTLTSTFIAAGADVNAQDYMGRTALHAAFTSRSEQCVTAVLASNPDLRKTTDSDKQTVLHTADRMGQPMILKMMPERDPGLKFMENAHGQTPLALVENILADLSKFQTEMARHHRRIGTQDDFEVIGAILKADETIH